MIHIATDPAPGYGMTGATQREIEALLAKPTLTTQERGELRSKSAYVPARERGRIDARLAAEAAPDA